ncbi:hypothetical protein [Mucilaginibacter aquariorum]|uniref:Uncharacterized protein n=1 Tax=Mucilaginibacter aquariorum TaxID=2967225 RepID=A0ABT1SZD4_9SPHI|nr:hypothetical protein [Mucilaginibacter aquariorum]MCQ6957575.1 hypothetical protein [Mucilaginibacter aquariorum]
MKIGVKDPSTGALLYLQVKPENINGLHGFRIMHENGSSFLIINRLGKWQSADDHHVDAEFLVNIGLALEGEKIQEQIVQNKYQ